jgi:hypothetical protein
MFLRSIAAVVALVLLAGAASAQLLPVPPSQRPPKPENDLQRAESERNYRAATTAIPDKKPSKDPWKSVRSAPQQKQESYDRHRPIY